MLQPPLPADEQARLDSLRALQILDTAPEERFDRITRLATLAFDVPIALVSLVDHDRQWFKSCQGLDVRQTGRDISFCGHAILADEPLIIEDALTDDRFADNPLVTGGPKIRFYAGTPLGDDAGHKLGTLCLIDRVPRVLDARGRALLRELGAMVETELSSIAREELVRQRDEVLRRLEATTEAIDEGLITTDGDGTILSTNRAAQEIFGFSRGELDGRPISSLLPLHWEEHLAAEAARTRAASADASVELVGHRRDGRSFAMTVSNHRTMHDDDRLAVIVVRDVTAVRGIEDSLRHSQRLYESVFAAMHGAVMVLDAQGEVIAANDRAREIAAGQYSPDERVQDWRIDRIDLDGRSIPFEERPIPITLATGRPVHGKVMGFPEESGDIRWLEINTQPLIDSGDTLPYAVVLTMDDITARLELDRLKSQFVSVVSHELRTPLTAIQGSLSLLNSGALGEVSGKARRMLEMAHHNTERLVRLVNDILDLQRMESDGDRLLLEHCTDIGLFDEVTELMAPLADEAGVVLSVNPADLSLTADRDRLLQTLGNLVDNAIKFSERGDHVTLTSRRDGDEVRFSVSDEGRGIPRDKLESIFGRFQQVEASDARAKGGTGLGLAICKRIVEQHGGTIRAESTLGRGSELIFTIPAKISWPTADTVPAPGDLAEPREATAP